MKISRTVYLGFLAATAFTSRFAVAADESQSIEAIDMDTDLSVDVDATTPDQDFDVNTRTVTCYVNNARGQVFSAVGVDARRVSQRALNKCLRVSVRCSAAACRY